MSFNLADVLKAVPESDTGREQIEYIKLENIDSDAQNFYQLSELPELAANIATCGLQQPIRVRPNPDADGRYIIVSGHRRRAALELLAQDDAKWADVPCIVERDDASPALRQLRLIYANADTRKLTSAEIGEQAAQVEKLLYQLKEEGYEFPGRMRDHVAQAVNQSKSKLARLAVIRKGLKVNWMPCYQKGDLTEDAAYHLAQLPEYLQREIAQYAGDHPRMVTTDMVTQASEMDKKVGSCSHGCGMAVCPNRAQMVERVIQNKLDYNWRPTCPGCCKGCENIHGCKYSCQYVAEEKRAHRAEQREEKRQEAERQAEKDKPAVDFLTTCYDRIFAALAHTGYTVEELAAVMSNYKYHAIGNLNAYQKDGHVVKANDSLPYGYQLNVYEAMGLVKAANFLGLTTDYLLGRDEPKATGSGWHTGHPVKHGDYVVLYYIDHNGTRRRNKSDIANWNGKWRLFGLSAADAGLVITAWTDLPEEE